MGDDETSADRRRVPSRSQSSDCVPIERTASPRSARLPARSKSADEVVKQVAIEKRKPKKGICVAITVTKKTEEKDDDDTSSNANENKDLNRLFDMQVKCTGKFNRKAVWPDVDAFWKDKTVDAKSMCDILQEYSEMMYRERRGAENVRPKKCFLRDERLRGVSYYRNFGWDEVKLHLKGDKSYKINAKSEVEIQESWTKQVTLEHIPVDFSTDLETILINQGDKAVVSTLTKSKLQGDPLAQSMMTSETQILVELRGLDSVVFCMGNDEAPHDTDPETGNEIWRDVKTLRALLHDKPFPRKEGKGTQRMVEVVAFESFVKARVHYVASFKGDVVSDHVGKLLGERWYAHPLKDIMNGFRQENAARIYEDIELRFFSEIGYKMENEYFDWEKDEHGRWIKVKKPCI